MTFLLDMLAGGPVLKTTIVERGSQRGFNEDQLRRAREKAGIVTFKEKSKAHGRNFWARPEHVPAGQQHENDDSPA